MKLDECEETIFSLMAEMDGETPILSQQRAAQHLTKCAQCREEIERQKAAVELLQKHKRRTAWEIDLWPEVQERIGDHPTPKSAGTLSFFFLLGAVLVTYKLLEMIPARDFGLFFKLVPLGFVAALFYFFRENPFKINTDLNLGG
jgi:predicted anti-sigma-YlaC factor YlaD